MAIVAEVIEFARRARLLQHILDPAQENDDAVRTALQRLAAWGGQISYPTECCCSIFASVGFSAPSRAARW